MSFGGKIPNSSHARRALSLTPKNARARARAKRETRRDVRDTPIYIVTSYHTPKAVTNSHSERGDAREKVKLSLFPRAAHFHVFACRFLRCASLHLASSNNNYTDAATGSPGWSRGFLWVLFFYEYSLATSFGTSSHTVLVRVGCIDDGLTAFLLRT